MRCSSRTSTLETKLGKVSRYQYLRCNPGRKIPKSSSIAASSTRVRWVEHIEELGFDAMLSDQQDHDRPQHLLVAYPPLLHNPRHPLGHLLFAIITTPAQFWVGEKSYQNAYKALKYKSATMNVHWLTILGTFVAYFHSQFTLIAAAISPNPRIPRFVFFDTRFVPLGRYLENSAKGKTSAAPIDLEKKIPTELLQIGEIVEVVSGDKFRQTEMRRLKR
ncbi:hypothetical protein EI94DRAFT_1821305 [Lactarius quietus]|nr:hypothetical protein EI94DRAFT_1821305 [Lactarius quietus]